MKCLTQQLITCFWEGGGTGRVCFSYKLISDPFIPQHSCTCLVYWGLLGLTHNEVQWHKGVHSHSSAVRRALSWIWIKPRSANSMLKTNILFVFLGYTVPITVLHLFSKQTHMQSHSDLWTLSWPVVKYWCFSVNLSTETDHWIWNSGRTCAVLVGKPCGSFLIYS